MKFWYCAQGIFGPMDTMKLVMVMVTVMVMVMVMVTSHTVVTSILE